MRKLRVILTMLLAVLAAASDYGEAAAASITIESTGIAAYSIKATDLQESAGMDLSISYDAATLKDPKLVSGALIPNSLMESNTATPGVIRVGIATGGVIKGTGELVSISFTKVGNTPAPKPTVSSSVYSTTFSQLAVQSINQTQQPEKDKINEDGSKISTNTGSGGTSVMPSTPNPVTVQTTTLSSVSMPQEASSTDGLIREKYRIEERRDEPVYQDVPASGESPTGGAAPFTRDADTADDASKAKAKAKAAGTGAALKTSQSVLDRFRVDKGIRTLKRLSTLFDQSETHAAGIIQSPAIVVSDGKALVTITVELPHEVDTPSFSLKGANLKSIRRVSDRKWELDALPQKGKQDVRLSILLKRGHTEIPLVAVPPVGKAGVDLTALSDVSLDALLAKPVRNSKPAYDLNADSRQDYLDDYILIGHWLLKQQHGVKGAGRKPAASGK